LPFEGLGAISAGRLEFLSDIPQFDWNSIAVVILHLTYSARDGGTQLRQKASEAVAAAFSEARGLASTRLLNLRQEFPSAWAKFKAVTIAAATPTAALEFELVDEHY